MKIQKCLIKSKNNEGDFIKWEDKCIVFDNPIQAGDFIRKHPAYKEDVEFGNAIQFADEILLDFPYIEYNDLIQREDYKTYLSIKHTQSENIEARMTKKEFLNLIKESVTDCDKLVKIVIKPKHGWEFELRINVTEILYDDIVFISNAFSKTQPPMRMSDIINILSENSSYDEKDVIFEIYGFDGESNEQIMINYVKESDLSFVEDDCYIYMVMDIDSIKSYYSTKGNKEDEDMKFVIQNTSNGLYSLWNRNVIVFDTLDEINQHIKENHYFYNNTPYKIIPKPVYFDFTINYKDIVNTDEYKESCVYEA